MNWSLPLLSRVSLAHRPCSTTYFFITMSPFLGCTLFTFSSGSGIFLVGCLGRFDSVFRVPLVLGHLNVSDGWFRHIPCQAAPGRFWQHLSCPFSLWTRKRFLLGTVKRVPTIKAIDSNCCYFPEPVILPGSRKSATTSLNHRPPYPPSANF